MAHGCAGPGDGRLRALHDIVTCNAYIVHYRQPVSKTLPSMTLHRNPSTGSSVCAGYRRMTQWWVSKYV